MAIDQDAKRRWRLGRVGNVPIFSARGLGAISFMAVAAFFLFVPPIISLVSWLVTGTAPETGDIDRKLLALNLAFNAIFLLLLPLLAIVLTRPGERGAIARRLRLSVDRRTPVAVLIGVGLSVAGLLALGGVLAGLEKLGVYTAEESDLVPQIQAILTPVLVVAVPLVAAVTEEVYFRGVLQPRVGIIASSVLFGLVHAGYGTMLQVVAPVLLGFLFGLIFERTRSLWAAIAAHFTFDFIEFLALYLLPPQ